GGPPRTPGSPRPASRIRCPSCTPGGIRTFSRRVLVTPPVPWHSGHFSCTIVPTPWHSRHGSEKLNDPWLRVTSPVPPQTGHVRGLVPGLAPLPRQVSHTPGARRVSGRVAPCTASAKSMVTSASTSRPRAAPVRWVPPREKIELNRSEKLVPLNRRSPAPPTRSEMSNGASCAPRRYAPEPNSARISSYSLRFFSSESTWYASETSL